MRPGYQTEYPEDSRLCVYLPLKRKDYPMKALEFLTIALLRRFPLRRNFVLMKYKVFVCLHLLLAFLKSKVYQVDW